MQDNTKRIISLFYLIKPWLRANVFAVERYKSTTMLISLEKWAFFIGILFRLSSSDQSPASEIVDKTPDTLILFAPQSKLEMQSVDLLNGSAESTSMNRSNRLSLAVLTFASPLMPSLYIAQTSSAPASQYLPVVHLTAEQDHPAPRSQRRC
jgi:hypothetical protein